MLTTYFLFLYQSYSMGHTNLISTHTVNTNAIGHQQQNGIGG